MKCLLTLSLLFTLANSQKMSALYESPSSPSVKPGVMSEASPMSNKETVVSRAANDKSRISRNAFTDPQFDAYGPPVVHPVPHHPVPHHPVPHYKEDIKVLPLPIPIGLPVPVHPKHGYGHGHGHGYGYPGYDPEHAYPDHLLYKDGLFAGFGGEKKYDGPNKLGYDVIRASFLSSRSNPLVHLLAAPYLKNVREHGGKDLPTVYELQDLLEQAAFGLTHVDHHEPHHQPYVAKRKDE